MHCAFIACCYQCRRARWAQMGCLPTCRLSDLLGSWRGGGEHSRDAGRRRKIAALQKKRGGHTRRYLPPKKGRRRKEVCPPRIDTHTETVRKKANEEEQPASTPPHGGGQYLSRKAPYRPESGSTKVSANASMKASRLCSAPREGWPGYLKQRVLPRNPSCQDLVR